MPRNTAFLKVGLQVMRKSLVKWTNETYADQQPNRIHNLAK